MEGRLTNSQGKFLRTLIYHGGSVVEVAKEVGSPLHHVERWMGEAVFSAHLEKRLEGLDRLRELDVRRGASQAARRLSCAAFGNGDFTKANLFDRRACVDLIFLARSEARAMREEKRRARERREMIELRRPEEVSEREWVRERTGEEGVRAYDEMVGRENQNDETRMTNQ
jgi:hypothetical protein